MGSDNRARRAQRSRDKTREVRRLRRTTVDLEVEDVEELDRHPAADRHRIR